MGRPEAVEANGKELEARKDYRARSFGANSRRGARTDGRVLTRALADYLYR
ncbi:MAG TPA: hypothetical protein VHC69_27175 [Polyangiaceae bacterium]|nr:hypothetical protein [Polyangiaceae bacterium]